MGKYWMCPICNKKASAGTFACMSCRLWCHLKCCKLTMKDIKKIDQTKLVCSKCKQRSLRKKSSSVKEDILTSLDGSVVYDKKKKPTYSNNRDETDLKSSQNTHCENEVSNSQNETEAFTEVLTDCLQITNSQEIITRTNNNSQESSRMNSTVDGKNTNNSRTEIQDDCFVNQNKTNSQFQNLKYENQIVPSITSSSTSSKTIKITDLAEKLQCENKDIQNKTMPKINQDDFSIHQSEITYHVISIEEQIAFKKTDTLCNSYSIDDQVVPSMGRTNEKEELVSHGMVVTNKKEESVSHGMVVTNEKEESVSHGMVGTNEIECKSHGVANSNSSNKICNLASSSTNNKFNSSENNILQKKEYLKEKYKSQMINDYNQISNLQNSKFQTGAKINLVTAAELYSRNSLNTNKITSTEEVKISRTPSQLLKNEINNNEIIYLKIEEDNVECSTEEAYRNSTRCEVSLSKLIQVVTTACEINPIQTLCSVGNTVVKVEGPDQVSTVSGLVPLQISNGAESSDQLGEKIRSFEDMGSTPTMCKLTVGTTVSIEEIDESALSCKLTAEMIKEEEQIKSEQTNELEEVRRKALEELKGTGQQQRFDRLQTLLNRSNLYATYLLQRIKDREVSDKKKKERKDKKKEEKKLNSSSQESSQDHSQSKNSQDQTIEKKKKKTKKRKRKEEDDENKNIDVKRIKVENECNAEKERLTKEKCNDATDPTPTRTVNDERIPDKPTRRFNGEQISDKQPLLMTGAVMRKYQIEGMDWLRGLFEHGINGILADEMGLGKTIQSIGLIASLIESNIIGPFIIVAPLSTLTNWMAEFKKFAPEINAILYHGSIIDRANMRRKLMRFSKNSHRFKHLPVLVTSFEIAMRDRVVLEQFNIEWKFMIVDEGHRIKNLNCKLIRELKLYKTANRLLLTGTPLQNNLAELWSLLNFLLPDIFDDLNSFQSWFDFSAVDDDNNELFAKEQETQVLQTLHSILTPFLLRRLKSDVDLSIPPKKEILVYAPLTAKQEEFYKTTLDKTIYDTLNKKNKAEEPVEYSAAGRVRRSATKKIKYRETFDDEDEFDLDVLIREVEDQDKRLKEFEEVKKQDNRKAIINVKLQNILMLLRKCCNHPYLLEFPFDSKTQQLVIDERLVECSGKMLLLDRMLPELKRLGHKTLIFSQMNLMLDILADYCGIRNYKFSRIDGSMNILDRQTMIENFQNDPETAIFLLSTRAGGLGLNLMAADTCIIYDSDWNPQADLQAQDRCHRIGQKKPVVIYRLCTANTVDQKIIERAASKRKLEKMVIHKKNFKGRGLASAVSPKELLELLASKDESSTVDGNIISDEHLKQLLDRSDLMLAWNNKQNKNKDNRVKEGVEKVKIKLEEGIEPKSENRVDKSVKKIMENADATKKIFKILEAHETENVLF